MFFPTSLSAGFSACSLLWFIAPLPVKAGDIPRLFGPLRQTLFACASILGGAVFLPILGGVVFLQILGGAVFLRGSFTQNFPVLGDLFPPHSVQPHHVVANVSAPLQVQPRLDATVN